MRVLVATAVAAERDAVARAATAGPGGDGIDVVAVGVGPAAAAAGTARALTAATLGGHPYDLVISAGIGGGFAPEAPVGSLVVADAIVAADLGAETPTGFLPVTELGFGTVSYAPPVELVRALAAATGAATGTVLTVSTATGTADRAAALRARHPGARAEAMEGFGVAEAAAAEGVPVAEVRAVSNPVGPRDRATWRIGDALAALTEAFTALGPVFRTSPASRGLARTSAALSSVADAPRRRPPPPCSCTHQTPLGSPEEHRRPEPG